MCIFSEVQSFLLPLYFFFFFKPDVDVIARFINTVDRATHTIYISRADPRSPLSSVDCLLIVETYTEKKENKNKNKRRKEKRKRKIANARVGFPLYSDTIDRSHRATFKRYYTIGYRKYPLHRRGNVVRLLTFCDLDALKGRGGERNHRVNGGNIVAWKKRRREERGESR